MKTFKGVISNWKRVGGRIEGTAMWHREGLDIGRAVAAPNPGVIANGHGMYTSELLGTVFKSGDFEIVETRNSYYLLLGAEKH